MTGDGSGHEHPPAHPSGPASVLLDLGEGTGALVIYTGPELLGQEIEVSALDGGRRLRTHATVRERLLRPCSRYGAVIPALPVGRYVVWRDPDTPLTTVTVTSGGVAECQWPGHPTDEEEGYGLRVG